MNIAIKKVKTAAGFCRVIPDMSTCYRRLFYDSTDNGIPTPDDHGIPTPDDHEIPTPDDHGTVVIEAKQRSPLRNLTNEREGPHIGASNSMVRASLSMFMGNYCSRSFFPFLGIEILRYML